MYFLVTFFLWCLSIPVAVIVYKGVGNPDPLTFTETLPQTAVIFGSYGFNKLAGLIYRKTHLNKTRIVQLRNGKFMLYQYMKYVKRYVDLGTRSLNYEVYGYAWKPYGDGRAVIKDGPDLPCRAFNTGIEAKAFKDLVDEFFKNLASKEEHERVLEDGYKPRRIIR